MYIETKMRLFIVESPAKCSKIREYLGSGWQVLATMGHICGLEENIDSIGADRGWEPRFHILEGKTKAYKDIQKAAKEASEVWLGTDDDREGEAISWHLCQLLKLPVTTTPRAIFHEVTAPAIQASVSNKLFLDMNKVQAQLGRAMLDLMVGFTISPCLWKSIGGGLSAGRCQTPALRLVYDKETEINAFSSSQSWVYEATWTSGKVSIDCVASWKPVDAVDAREYLEKVSITGKITDIADKSITQQPPLPLITSSLQQEISSQYHINPKITMSIAQKLYESGHITYMRTDNPVIGDEAKAEICEYILSTYGEQFLAGTSKTKTKTKIKTKESVVQGAHEAIRPTHVDITSLPTEETWSDQERKVYAFIWQRSVQSMMTASQQKTRTVTFTCDCDSKERVWKGSVSMLVFKGWKILQESGDDEDFLQTNSLKVGDKACWKSMNARQVATQPPSRFSEAQLVRALEEKGIGRPSTFATLISTISDRKYVEKKSSKGIVVELLKLERVGKIVKQSITQKEVGGDKDKIHITTLGTSVVDYVNKHFAEIFEYGFTAQMEDDLDLVAHAQKNRSEILAELWTRIQGLLTESPSTIGTSYSQKVIQTLGDITVANTKKGVLLIRAVAGSEKPQYAGLPEGKKADTITQEEAESAFEKKKGNVFGSLDGYEIIIKSGQYGLYAEWNGTRVKYVEGQTVEEVEKTLKSKVEQTEEGFQRIVGEYTIKKGPYGLYFFKTALKVRKNIKFPAGMDSLTITASDLENVAKASASSKKQGFKRRS
jgi:DNA topoisomerase-1